MPSNKSKLNREHYARAWKDKKIEITSRQLVLNLVMSIIKMKMLELQPQIS